MPDRLTLICSFLSAIWPEHPYELTAISGDASFRRYFRVFHQQRPYVLMDAPPTLEDGARFIAVQQALAAAGLRVPAIVANDLAIQVHGGYGYTREYNVEQFYRFKL